MTSDDVTDVLVAMRELIPARHQLVETIPTTEDPNMNLQVATSNLLKHRAQFVEDALRDNPTGPVSMLTEIGDTSVTYQVVVGSVDQHPLDPPSRTVWHREVVFGQTDRTVAGGADFVAAARAQEDVAWSITALIKSRA